jgi:hypothetical protein
MMQDLENKKWAVRGQNFPNSTTDYNNGPN